MEEPEFYRYVQDTFKTSEKLKDHLQKIFIGSEADSHEFQKLDLIYSGKNEKSDFNINDLNPIGVLQLLGKQNGHTCQQEVD